MIGLWITKVISLVDVIPTQQYNEIARREKSQHNIELHNIAKSSHVITTSLRAAYLDWQNLSGTKLSCNMCKGEKM